MLTSINNSFIDLYRSKELPGKYLRGFSLEYHDFFVEKITNSQGLEHIAYRIAHIVSGIILYPILGLLGIIGLLVDVFAIPGLKKHNEREFEKLSKLLINCFEARLVRPPQDVLDKLPQIKAEADLVKKMKMIQKLKFNRKWYLTEKEQAENLPVALNRVGAIITLPKNKIIIKYDDNVNLPAECERLRKYVFEQFTCRYQLYNFTNSYAGLRPGNLSDLSSEVVVISCLSVEE